MRHVPEKSSEELLAEKVQALLAEKPWGPHWQYIVEVAKTLREYVLARYHVVSFPQGGSGRIFLEAIKGQLPPPIYPLLQGLFETIDDIVALQVNSYPQLEHFRSKVQEIINFKIT
jgi:hypothetical protein